MKSIFPVKNTPVFKCLILAGEIEKALSAKLIPLNFYLTALKLRYDSKFLF